MKEDKSLHPLGIPFTGFRASEVVARGLAQLIQQTRRMCWWG
jgi:hypothetical protein